MATADADDPRREVQPLPELLPDTLYGLHELRQRIAAHQERVLSELRIRQQLLHSALRSCRAVVHARLDANAVDALRDADNHAEAWQMLNDQLTLVRASIDAAAQREQTGRLQ